MKLNISINGQKISGGWTSWNNQSLNSETDQNYNEVRNEIIEKLQLSVGPKTGRIKAEVKTLSLGELCSLEISLFMPDNFSSGRKYFNDDKMIKIKVLEYN